MTTVFADGEPVDPQKLRDLQTQITEIRSTAGSAYNLIATTINGATKNYTYHSQSNYIEFTNLSSGGAAKEKSAGIVWDQSKYENPVTVVSPVLDTASADVINVVVKSGTDFAPFISAYYKDSAAKPAALAKLRVNIVSVAKIIVT